MKVSTLELILEEILEESNKIKKLKSKLDKETKPDKKDEMLGLLNAYVFHLQTHCTLLNNDLNKVNSWKELEKK